VQNKLIPLPPIERAKPYSSKGLKRLLHLIVDIYGSNCLRLTKDNLNTRSKRQTYANLFFKKQYKANLYRKTLMMNLHQYYWNAFNAEKEKLIKEKKIKRDKNESIIYKGSDGKYYEQIGKNIKCIDDEMPFEIPQSWNWCRLSTIATRTIGKTPPRGEHRYWSNGLINWVSISDMNEYRPITRTKEKISKEAFDELFHRRISQSGSLLMSFKLTVGRTSILGIDAVHNEAIITIIPFIDENYKFRNYLKYLLPIVSNLGDFKDAIKGKTLNNNSIANLLIPLPPINEQKRIVDKIELLFNQLK
jgi:type I restriction enzyme S subunit